MNKVSNGLSYPVFSEKDVGICRIISQMSSPLFAQTSGDSKFALHMSTLNDLKDFSLEFFQIQNTSDLIKFAESEMTRLLIATKSRIVICVNSNECCYFDDSCKKILQPSGIGIVGEVLESQTSSYISDC